MVFLTGLSFDYLPGEGANLVRATASTRIYHRHLIFIKLDAKIVL
jgi:hypothetical protein